MQRRQPPATASSSRRFDALELLYLGAAAQTVLFNPVIGAVGTLRVYANGLSWAIVATFAAVRCVRSRDRVLLGASLALLVATWAAVTAIVFQMLFMGIQLYSVGSFVRMLYVPLGILSGLAVYRRIDRILDIVIVIVGLECLILLFGSLGGPVDLTNRLNPASLGGRTTLGAFLMTLIILRASVWSYRERRPRASVLVSMAAALAAMILTLTRSSLIGLLVGLAVLSVTGLRRRGHLTGATLRRSGIAALLSLPAWMNPAVRQRFTSLSLSKSSGRDEIWRASANRFAESPVVGHGFGSFDYASRALVEDFVTAAKFGPSDPTVANHTSSTHNLVWQVLVEGGLVGLIVVTWSIWYFIRRCWHPILLPVLLALLADGMFQTIPYVVQTSWILGLVFGLSLLYRHSPAQRVATTR